MVSGLKCNPSKNEFFSADFSSSLSDDLRGVCGFKLANCL